MYKPSPAVHPFLNRPSNFHFDAECDYAAPSRTPQNKKSQARWSWTPEFLEVMVVLSMNATTPLAESPPASKSVSGAQRYTGEVVYIYAYDVAYEMGRQPVQRLLGQPAEQFAVDASKRYPRQMFLYKPTMFRLPPVTRTGPHGPVSVRSVVKLLPVGAISISVHVPFAVDHVEDLVVYHDLQFERGSLHEEMQQLAEQLRQELAPYSVRPVPKLAEEEAYTVFCLAAPMTAPDGAPVKTQAWWQAHRRQVAALLTQEPDIDHLSKQESDESTGRFLTYYEHDLVVIDWDAALVIDERRIFDETVYLMELANLQLAELEAYDRILDEALERAYRDLRQRRLLHRTDLLRQFREIRIDLARFSDELSNITKFFGDWHLARIYQNLSARFHLADWNRSINEKLKTLDDLYQLLHHDHNNLWMMILEVTIVLLFIIDLLLLFTGQKHPS
jgi:hypothetical protein